jgi:hypothetical protein
MCGWQTEKNSRISRERTGGAGYLAVNTLGDHMIGSHSGNTAEGDNKVLMQKVVKDILQDHRKKIHDNVKFSDAQIQAFKNAKDLASNFEMMRDLIYYRETF